MQTDILNENQIGEAAKAIKHGHLIAFPTETVYGLGADATNEQAVKAVYAAKGRPSDNPLIVHIADKSSVAQYVDIISKEAQILMDTFWPGPLTLIFELKNTDVLPGVVTGGLTTAAFRMPDNKLTLELITQSNTVLVGPSANTSGKPSPTTAHHVYHDLKGHIRGILDGGSCEVGVESTVLDVSNLDEAPVILRPGAITKHQIESIIGQVTFDGHLVTESEVPKAPGMKYKHYSPDTTVQMIDDANNNWDQAITYYLDLNKKVGLLANKEIIQAYGSSCECYQLSETRDVRESMKHLFAGLRELDQLEDKLDIILVETYPEDDGGMAYMNRLKKAANQDYFIKA
ncbi:MAG: L-threonylcarbamoyladenylate synthase [Vagococcus sp.]